MRRNEPAVSTKNNVNVPVDVVRANALLDRSITWAPSIGAPVSKSNTPTRRPGATRGGACAHRRPHALTNTAILSMFQPMSVLRSASVLLIILRLPQAQAQV